METRFNQAMFIVRDAEGRGLTKDQAFEHCLLDALRRYINRTFNRAEMYWCVAGAAKGLYADAPDLNAILESKKRNQTKPYRIEPYAPGVTLIADGLNSGRINITEAERYLRESILVDVQIWNTKELPHALGCDSAVPGPGGDRRGDGGTQPGTREG